MKKVLGILGAAALAFGAAAQTANADGDLHEVVVNNWGPTDFFSFGGLTSNPVVVLNLAPGTVVNGVYWNLTVVANDPAWLSDFGIAIMPIEHVPGGGPGVILTPGIGDDFAGVGVYEGGLKLADAGIADIVLPSGQLWIEGFDWDSAFPGLKNISGSIWIQTEAVMPAPGALALLGLAGLVGVRRRRN